MMRSDLRAEVLNFTPSSEELEYSTIPEFKIITVSGAEAGGKASEYQTLSRLLYATAVALKALVKEEKDAEYVIPPMESLFWVRKNESFELHDRATWLWTSFFAVPDFISGEDYREAVEKVKIKNPEAKLHLMKFERINEGMVLQTLHNGQFNPDSYILSDMLAKLSDEGYILNGKYHEIYLTEKFGKNAAGAKTVIRIPVKKRKKQQKG